MNLRFWFFLTASILLGPVITSPLPAKDNKKQEAEALLARAHELSDIRCEGCPAFQLRGTFRWREPTGEETLGSYELNWLSPGEWGDTISSSRYGQTRVRKGEKLWRHRNFSVPSMRFFEFFETIDLRKNLRLRENLILRPKAKVNRLRGNDEGNPGLKCFEVVEKGFNHGESCFEPLAGLLVRQGDTKVKTEYLEYAPLGSKLFPRRIRYIVRGQTVMEFVIENLFPVGSQEARSLEIPVGSREFPTCDSPPAPKILKKTQPIYPAAALSAHVAGTVRIIAEVDSEGKVQNAFVGESPNPTLSKAAVDAVSNWLYTPADCGGTKVPQEFEIDVHFSLSK